MYMTNDVNDKGTSDDEPRSDNVGDLVDKTTVPICHNRYKEAMKGRGEDAESMKKKIEGRLRLAKERNYCSICKRRGHWHKDDICPFRKGSVVPPSSKPQQKAHVHRS